MRWDDFKQHVKANPNYQYPKEIQRYADAIRTAMNEGVDMSDISANRVGQSFDVPKLTVLSHVRLWGPSEAPAEGEGSTSTEGEGGGGGDTGKTKEKGKPYPSGENQVKEAQERNPPPSFGDEIERRTGGVPGGAVGAIQRSLGVAYASTISRVANRLTWFGDALMGIGSEAFLGYLMSMQLPPDEVQQKLLTFASPDALVRDFKEYFGNLLQSSAEASALTVMERRLECTKALAAAYQWKLEELIKAHFELSRMTSMAVSMLSPNQLKRLYLAKAIESLGSIDTLTPMPPPGPEGQPPAKPKEEPKEGEKEGVA